jgi:methyl-accepting chemotaxis protein
LIGDIADQSNVLTLNGAIEAARERSNETGFAVVAREMQKLAEYSSRSTEEIQQLITTIQTETDSTVVGIQDSTKWVEKELEMIRETAQSAKEISMATQQQRSASVQTVQAMQSINAVTKQFDATTQQTLASAEELERLSQELQKAIGGFKLSDGGATPN